MTGKGKPPEHEDAPRFPLQPGSAPDSPWERGPGNAALTGTKVVVPGTGVSVRVVDWTHPKHVDVPVVVSIIPQDWVGALPNGWFWNNTPYNRIRGVIEYARGQQKIREQIGMSANGIVWRGTVREFVCNLRRTDGGPGGSPLVDLLVIASITQEDYIPQRTRQGTLFDNSGEAIVSTPQRIPYGATRYRASVDPFAAVADIQFLDSAFVVVLDTVPALAVADWQALPSEFAAWQQAAPNVVGPFITLEFE